MHITLRSGALLYLSLAFTARNVWASGPAGIKPDGSLGPSAAALVGPTYGITQNLGKLSGGNLFFSFQYFNVATGETALFTTTSAGINNVISRVTGGYASTIDGRIELQAASGAPNFFLINPSGVTFTANAVVDVPAAFHVSTANYLKFSDGNFYVDPSKMSTLSAAAPEAFGFLGTTRAPVNIEGATLQAGAVGDGEFEIAAGDVTIDGLGASGGIENASGDVRVTAVGSQATEVPLSGAYTSHDGAVTIQNGGAVFMLGHTGLSAGAFSLSAGALTIEGSDQTNTGIVSGTEDIAAGPISINVTGATLLADGGGVYSFAFGAGTGANIALNTGSLIIRGASVINPTGVYAENDAAGGGGAIYVNAGTLVIDGTSTLASTLDTGIETLGNKNATGTPGSVVVNVSDSASISNNGVIGSLANGLIPQGADVTVSTGSLNIDGGASNQYTGIFSESDQQIPGYAGNVTVTSSGTLSVLQSSHILSDANGLGNAGNVVVHAGSLQIEGVATNVSAGGSSTLPTIVGSDAIGGNAGDVTITSDGPITMQNYAEINSFSIGANAGNVDVSSASLTITGRGGAGATQILDNALGSGSGGNVTISVTGMMAISSVDPTAGTNAGAGIEAAVTGSGAGNVTINVGALTISGNGFPVGTDGILTTNLGSSPNGGRTTIVSQGPVSVLDGGYIGSGTAGGSAGNAGDVAITASTVTIDGGSSGQLTSIYADTLGSGSAGSVSVIATGALTLANGGRISSDTEGYGNAGNVSVHASSLSMDGGAAGIAQTESGPINVTAISSSVLESVGFGSAGSVAVIVAGPVSLTDGAEISTNTAGFGDAGDVSISTPGTLTIGSGVNGSLIDSAARGTALGQPGTVSVSAGTLLINSNGFLSVEDDRSLLAQNDFNPHQITIRAADIALDGGAITANSTGTFDASSIDIQYTQSLRATDAKITTSAYEGNGGAITINGAGTLFLNDSQITTSVTAPARTSILGTSSNGGDINISVPYIVMNSAAIQANTAVPLASGGSVTINALALVPSFQSFILGGSALTLDSNATGLNVVQAAAPTGVSGVLNVTVPTLDLGNALLGLTGRPAAPSSLGRGLCRLTHGSSLVIGGRGGLAPTAYDPLWIDPDETWREASIGSSDSSVATADIPDGESGALLACR